jgi:hypothetical protein
MLFVFPALLKKNSKGGMVWKNIKVQKPRHPPLLSRIPPELGRDVLFNDRHGIQLLLPFARHGILFMLLEVLYVLWVVEVLFFGIWTERRVTLVIS